MSVSRRGGGTLVWGLVAVAVAALSLLVVPFAPAYDPWAWITWGREAAALRLDTSGGPAFKPLTVLVTTPLALTGDAAPDLWLLVARAAGLIAVVLTATLAARLAGPASSGGGHAVPAVAATVAVVALLLTPAEDARYLRYVAQGLSEPLCVALVLGAIHRHLGGRIGQALLLGVAAGLVRPEAWPLAAAYVAWTTWSGRLDPRLGVGALAAMPIVWFGGDLLGSGSAVTGADRARQEEVSGTSAFEDALGMVVLPVWVLAAGLVARAAARRRGDDGVLLVLGAGAAAWAACVWGMAVVLDYAADPRFFLPAAAIVCVLAGIGAARALGAVAATATGRPVRAWLAAGAVVAVSVPLAAGRVDAIATEHWDLLEIREGVQSDLAAVLDRAEASGVFAACGSLSVDGRQTALEAPMRAAWELDVPLVTVSETVRPTGSGVAVVRRDRPRAARMARSVDARLVARERGWDVYAVRC